MSWLQGPSQAAAGTLLSACVAVLSSGTNYVYSAYAPQLGSRLHLSSVQQNLVGAAGNLGVYFSGPSVGGWVDRRGPRSPLVFGALSVCVGYALIRHIYDGGSESESFNTWGMPTLLIGELITGIGSSASLAAASNGVAKSFDAKRRGSALALVVSCFGLSAFVYSTLSHASFLGSSDPTSVFLLILSIGCGLSIGQGAIFIRPVLHATPHAGYHTIIDEEPTTDTTRITVEDDEQDSNESGLSLVSDEGDTRVREARLQREADRAEKHMDVSGLTLLQKPDFWIMFCIIGCCSGTGLMWINNLGTIARTLSHADKDPKEVAAIQASLVSLLSVFNCGGRLLSGFVSDYFLHYSPTHLRCGRGWWFVPVAGLFFVTQLIAASTTEVQGWSGLAFPTALTGIAYGALFGIMPTCCLEWFGLTNFSSNNGYLSLSPAIFGNTANIFFGHVYDKQVAQTPSIPIFELAERGGGTSLPDNHLCLLGKECFAAAFHATSFLTLVAFGLAIWLGFRKRKHYP